MVEERFVSFDLKVITSVLRFFNSSFNFKTYFSKFEIIFLEEETNFASLTDSLCKSVNASCNSSNEIDKLLSEDVTFSLLS